MASANGTRSKHLLTCVVIVFLVLCSFSIVNCDKNLPTTESDEDRAKNKIKEYVTYQDLDNEITTATPETQRYQKTPSPQVSTQNKKSTLTHESTTTQAPENVGSRGSSSRRRNDHVDSVDKYLLDGILNIVDEKFSSLNTRLMTMERGVNNLQYYSVRSFRVVNTHLHAIDTILHSMNNQLTQNENQNLLLEQAVGNIKTEMSDLQSMNSGVFQAIEQNLVHFHTDMQNRITEVKQDVEQVSSNVDQLRNSAREERRNIEILQEGQSHVINNLGDIVSANEEILQTSNSVLNLSMSIHETSEQNVYNTKKAKIAIDMTARTMYNLSRSTDEIRNGLSLVLANISSVQVARGEHDFVTEHRALKDFPFRESSDSIPCGQVLDILEEKLKTINFTVAESSARTPKNCDQPPPFDQEDFKNQSSQLLYALATVNENVFQSVTLYRHTGSLIERILSDTENIAAEQLRLREDLVAYLLNGTEELFNRSLPDFSNFVGSSWQRTGDSGYKADEDNVIVQDKCALTKPLLEEMSQLSKNGSQLVELLTDLALSSSSTIRNSLDKLDQGVSSLNKFQEDTLNGYLVNKVEAFSRDEKNTHLKDIKNKTDLIYVFAEAIASNTGWIPFVYHRIMFVENQVNKTLNYIINIDNNVKEMLIRQKANMAIIFKPKEKAEDSETSDTDADSHMWTSSNLKPTSSTPRLETVAGVQYTNESSAFDDMLRFVYQTNQKLNRLVPALTNLVGEPEPYITLVSGSSDKEGRVEVYNKGQWGTIPGPFSHVEASYVCRKLGYIGGVFAGNGVFGSGSGAFWNLNVTCLRTRWCNAVSEVNDPMVYSHDTDVGIICDHMLRLMKTNEEEEQEVTRHSGKLEIYHQNSWLPICFNGWGRKESSVVCQQLGFREGAARGVKDETLHDLRWMTNVTCAGREYRLDACASEFKFNGCKDNEYVSMICS